MSRNFLAGAPYLLDHQMILKIIGMDYWYT